MVVSSALAAVDFAIAVEVLVLDVAGAIDEGAGLDGGLVGYTFLIDPRSVGVLAFEVVLGEVTVGFEPQMSPQVSPA